MWSAAVDGRRLTFRLAGINNQNFIMRDDQTGTWWQQVSGLAIHGPLKGRRLQLVPHDQVTFAIWKDEQPKGQVLKLDETVAKEDEYVSADWEDRMATRPTPGIGTPLTGGLEPRTLMIGITLDGKSKAWPQHSVDHVRRLARRAQRRAAAAGDGRRRPQRARLRPAQRAATR